MPISEDSQILLDLNRDLGSSDESELECDERFALLLPWDVGVGRVIVVRWSIEHSDVLKKKNTPGRFLWGFVGFLRHS